MKFFSHDILGMNARNLRYIRTKNSADAISLIPDAVYKDIISYCQKMPEHHGWLDILQSKDGKYYFTENNFMTGYLCEEEERYLAKEWLEGVTSCYAL
jgi:hypothetical protein